MRELQRSYKLEHYYTYGVAIQTNAIFPISSYLFKFLLVYIIAVIIVNRNKWKVIVKPSNNIAYVEVSQFLRCQPKYRAMIGLRFTGDSDIRGHIHGDVTRADIAVLTHGVLSWEDVCQLRRTVTPSSGGQRSHRRYLWQKINTEWLSLQPDCDLLIKSFSFLVEDFKGSFFISLISSPYTYLMSHSRNCGLRSESSRGLRLYYNSI